MLNWRSSGWVRDAGLVTRVTSATAALEATAGGEDVGVYVRTSGRAHGACNQNVLCRQTVAWRHKHQAPSTMRLHCSPRSMHTMPEQQSESCSQLVPSSLRPPEGLGVHPAPLEGGSGSGYSAARAVGCCAAAPRMRCATGRHR